jgi:hypothetical protein
MRSDSAFKMSEQVARIGAHGKTMQRIAAMLGIFSLSTAGGFQCR